MAKRNPPHHHPHHHHPIILRNKRPRNWQAYDPHLPNGNIDLYPCRIIISKSPPNLLQLWSDACIYCTSTCDFRCLFPYLPRSLPHISHPDSSSLKIRQPLSADTRWLFCIYKPQFLLCLCIFPRVLPLHASAYFYNCYIISRASERVVVGAALPVFIWYTWSRPFDRGRRE